MKPLLYRGTAYNVPIRPRLLHSPLYISHGIAGTDEIMEIMVIPESFDHQRLPDSCNEFNLSQQNSGHGLQRHVIPLERISGTEEQLDDDVASEKGSPTGPASGYPVKFARVDTPLRVEPPPSFNAPSRPEEQTREQQLKARPG